MAYNLLNGKKGIIFVALNESSIAWKVAEKAHEEGAEFILTNAPIAMRMGSLTELAEKTNSEIFPADATSNEDLENLFNNAIEKFGKVDFKERRSKIRNQDQKSGDGGQGSGQGSGGGMMNNG